MTHPRWIYARRPGRCAACNAPFVKGAEVVYFPADQLAYSGGCAQRAMVEFHGADGQLTMA